MNQTFNITKSFYAAALSTLFILASCASIKGQVEPVQRGSIHVINSMAAVENYVTSDTLVLFDLDHTVFEGAEVYGHANWFYDQIREGKKRGIPSNDTIKKIFPVWLKSQEQTSVKPVEPLTPSLIKSLQSRGLKVMGLTARQTPLIPATLRQLAEIEVSFESSSLLPAIFADAEFEAPVQYRKGILFTSEFVAKSRVLKAYFKQVGYEPKRIVFVDDSYGHVEDIVNAFLPMGVDVVGLHYPLVEARRDTWDPALAAEIFSRRSQENTHSVAHGPGATIR